MTYDMHAFGRMYSEERKAALGLKPTAHLPDERPGTVYVHGITMFLETKGAVRGHKRQRMRACCPVCHKVFAAGNLAQHHNVHTEEGRALLRRKTIRTLERRSEGRARAAAYAKAKS